MHFDSQATSLSSAILQEIFPQTLQDSNGYTTSESGLKIALLFFLTIQDVHITCQGDEAGVRYVEGSQAGEGGDERIDCRTPKQRDETETSDFSSVVPTCLYPPLNLDSDRPNVAQQEEKPNSILSFVRNLLKLRRRFLALGAGGNCRTIRAKHGSYPYIFERCAEMEQFLIVLNPSSTKTEFAYSKADRAEMILAQNAIVTRNVEGGRLELGSEGFLLLRF